MSILEIVQFAILGLASGAIYVGIAGGLLTVYRSSGVLNFAQGVMAAWGAYVYEALKTTGTLVFPIGSVSLGGTTAPTAGAILISVACAALLGLLVQVLVFRPMRNAPVLGQVVASVAVMITIEALIAIRFTANQITMPSILPSGSFHVGTLPIGETQVSVTVIAVVLMTLLWAFFKYTTVGIACRASASNQRAVSLAGFSPNRLSAYCWTIGTALSGFLVMLAAPVTGLQAQSYALYVVPALAVLLLGRLTSIPVTTIAGFALGMFQAVITLLSTQTWWPSWGQNGLEDAVPFVIIIVILLASGKRLPSRGSLNTASLPKVTIPKLTATRLAVGLVIGAAALLLTSGIYRFGVISSMALVLIALSFVMISGYLGQISLAQIAFAGVAGFVLSKITTIWHVPFPFSLLISALVAALVGMAVGIPAFRIRGAQLAVVTVAAGVVIQNFVFGNPSFTPVAGLFVPGPSLDGLDLSVRSGDDVATLNFGFTVLIVLFVISVGYMLLARGETGRAMLAVRSNERAAAAAGLNVRQVKLIAFGLAGFVAGVGGCLIGYSQGELSVTSFAVFVGLDMLAVAYLGGITSLTGAVWAGILGPLGIVYVFLNAHIHFGQYYQLVAGLGLIMTAILNPEGIAGKSQSDFERLRARWARRSASVPASAVALAGGGGEHPDGTVQAPRVEVGVGDDQ
jgi:branched-chain amino acid transport system permease protein